MRTTHLDDRIYEYEIQAAKEAGFNFIGLELDFSWLQETALQDKEFDQYHGFVSSEDVGKFSLSRLEQLDQVIALCMKYDIHVNLRCTTLGGMNNSVNMEFSYFKEIEKAKKNDVPLYKDDKLANTLSKLKIGDMIPQELYEVVAEILVFVDDMDKLKAKIGK